MNKPMQYGIVDKEIMTDQTISITAKAVYAYLCCFLDNNNQCFPGLNLIATELNMSTRTVERYLKELRELKVIERKQIGYNLRCVTTVLHGGNNMKWRSENATLSKVSISKTRIEVAVP